MKETASVDTTAPAPMTALLIPLLCGAFLILGVISALFFLPFQQGNPLDPVFHFRYPESALSDSSGRLWVIDNGQRRLTFSANSQTVDWELSAEKNAALEKPWIIGVDTAGTLVFGNAVVNKDEDTTASEEILCVSPRGLLEPPLERRVYDKETRADYKKRMTFSQTLNGKIYYFFPVDAQKTELTTIQVATGMIQKTILPLGLDDWAAILVADDGKLFLMDKKGNLKVRDLKGAIGLLSANPFSGPLSIRKIENMVWGENGTVQVLDAKNHCLDIHRDGTRSLSLLNPGTTRSFQRILTAPDGTETGVDEYSAAIISEKKDGTERITKSLQYGLIATLGRLAGWAALVLGVCSFFGLLVIIYWRFFRQRIPLILKQLAIFIPLIIAAVIFVALLIYAQMYRNLETEVQNRLLFLSQIAARQLTGSGLPRLDPRTESFEDFRTSADYVELKNYLSMLVNNNADKWNASCYGYVYRKFGTDWYVFGPNDYVELYVYAKPEFETVLKDGVARTVRYDDVYGSWYSGLTPIRDASGTPYAVCEVTLNGNIFDDFNREFANHLVEGVLITLLVLVVCFSAFTWFLLLSLKALQKGANRITEGEYDVEIGIHSHDELQDLGTAFNRMSRQIRSQILHITQLNKANSKFVPAEFLENLGKQSILEVNLGDHVERSMTILFSDIRSFTSLSEKMSPDENFQFINDYLRLMGPIIREQKGFIDKYIGDAIMALFPADSDNALRTALEMVEKLEEFNSRHYAQLGTIKIGIGIHTGPLMMGIVGEKERYDGTVISDAVNLASRIEGLTKQYGVSIIISDDTVNSLKEPERFEMRFLDLVRVQGKQKPASVYELISPRDPNRKYKLETRETYQQAFEMYRRQQFAMASEIFRSLLSKCPDDKAVESLTRRALRLQAEGASATWDGIIELREK